MEEIIKWEKDFLTNCYTRNNLYQLLEKLQIESNLIKKPFSIMLIDLDHFKSMNDKYGHMFGDEVLKYFSSSMRLSLEGGDLDTVVQQFIFRFGGDEFVIVFPGKVSHEAYVVGVKILDIIKKRQFLFKGRRFKMSFSGGITTYPKDAKTIDEVIESADKAMYYSKKYGKGRVTQYSKINIERAKRVLSLFLAIASVLFLVATLLFKEKLRNFIFIDKFAKFEKVKQPKIHTFYLKAGGELRGMIISDKDPMEIKIILDRGEGSILLRKSEISKIVPEK